MVAQNKKPWKGDALRILFLSAEYPPQTGWGGIGSYVACIAPALANRGHDVHVLSCAAGQSSSDYQEDGISIHRRPTIRIKGLYRLSGGRGLMAARMLAGVSAFIHSRRLKVPYDVVEYPEWGAEGWMFALLRQKPTVAHLHTPTFILYRYNYASASDVRCASRFERLSVSRADVVSAPSQMVADDVASEGWTEGRTIRVIPHPVDWQRWRGGPKASETEPVVQFSGRLEMRKAPEVLMNAIGILRQDLPQVTGCFVGAYMPGSKGTPLISWASSYNLEGCSFIGHVPRSDLPAILQSCRVFAQPSLYENYSVAALEAMACGRPVVVTSKSGIAGFVARAGAGQVVPTEDPQALADALRPFLTNPGHAAEVGARAQSAVMRELDGTRIAELRESLYAEAIRAHGSNTSVSASALSSS